MISITETFHQLGYNDICTVGMAMYDFDHWNNKKIKRRFFMDVGMAMYDFDHWNSYDLSYFFNFEVGMAMYDFDHWN